MRRREERQRAAGRAVREGQGRHQLSAFAGQAPPGPEPDRADGLSAPGTWLELSVEVDQEAVEAVSEILSRVAPGGVTVEAPFEALDEGLGARQDLTRPAVLRAYLPGADASGARRARDEVRLALGHLQAFDLRPIGELRTRVVQEADWADAWKRHFPVLRVGRRLVVRPTWRRGSARPDDVVVALDPGMAFGTGLHPTTRLCLEGVERWADDGRVAGSRVLDLGCGSGILALAAAKLGASSVLAVDTDPVAVEATHGNVARNRLTRVVEARRGSLPLPEAPFDLVLANLVASLLIALAGPLRDATRPPASPRGSGGRLLASGIFTDREGEVGERLAGVGFAIVRRWSEGDWVAIEAERVAA